MKNKSKEIVVRVHIKMHGEYIPWESLSTKERKEIGMKLNDMALRSVGYVPAIDKTA